MELKKAEVGGLLDYFQKNSAGGGMSSFGPVCFGLCETQLEASALEEAAKTEFGFNAIKSKANNEGAIWL